MALLSSQNVGILCFLKIITHSRNANHPQEGPVHMGEMARLNKNSEK
jgi:hypothetical protein